MDEVCQLFQICLLYFLFCTYTLQVDLILHPLKSELNFPIGRKEALDLTQNRMGRGLRWELPHAVFDAIFYALDLIEGKPPTLTSALLASREAENVLNQLKDAVAEGVSFFFFFFRKQDNKNGEKEEMLVPLYVGYSSPNGMEVTSGSSPIKFKFINLTF